MTIMMPGGQYDPAALSKRFEKSKTQSLRQCCAQHLPLRVVEQRVTPQSACLCELLDETMLSF